MIIGEDGFNGVYNGENVEKQAKEYMSLLMDYTGGVPYQPETRVHEKIKYPSKYNVSLKGKKFLSYPREEQAEIRNFWIEQMRRMKEGHEGMCGLQYGYFNFANLRDSGKGELEYRRLDNDLFCLIESCMYGKSTGHVDYGNNKGKGLIEIGRRRSGKSSKIGWFINHLLRTIKNGDVIVTSKTEDDAQRVIINEKVYFMYDDMPVPLKPTLYKRQNGLLHLGYMTEDDAGNKLLSGRNSKVLGKTPKPEAVEGSTLMAWIHDEGPKTPKFKSLVDYTLPALADARGFDRDGFFYTTGVAGDFGKFGEDFMTVWSAWQAYDLVRWFSPGWYSLVLDDLKNEKIYESVIKILTRRNQFVKQKNLSVSAREEKIRKQQQQYPLTVQEALMSSETGLFNIMKLNEIKNALMEDPVPLLEGEMKWEVQGLKSMFMPGLGGPVRVLEPPQHGSRYVSGIDCYGLSQKGYGNQGAQWIFKLKNTMISPMEEEQTMVKLLNAQTNKERVEAHLKVGHLPVALYIDNPKDPKKFAERALMLSKWYMVTSRQDRPVYMLPETEPSNILDWLMGNCLNMVMPEPERTDKPHKYGEKVKSWGLPMKGEYWPGLRLGEISHFIEQYGDRLWFMELVDKLMTYNDVDTNKKYDIVDGFGLSLIAASSRLITSWNNAPRVKSQKRSVPIMNFRRRN